MRMRPLVSLATIFLPFFNYLDDIGTQIERWIAEAQVPTTHRSVLEYVVPP